MKKINFNIRKVGRFLARVINVVTAPVAAELGVFLLLLALFMLCTCFYHANCTESMSLSYEIHWIVKLLPVYVLISYMYVLLMYLAGLWRRWLRHLLCAAVLIANLTMTVAEICVMTFFTSAFNATIIMLVAQTTPDETESFFQSYVMSQKFVNFAMYFFGGTVASMALYWLLKRYLRRYLEIVARFVVVASTLYMVSIFANSQFRGEWLGKRPYTSIARFTNSYIACIRDALRDVNDDAGITAVGEGSPTIVMIIGESYNKHHASIYGYDKQTTPQQEAMRDSGNLYVFNDVIAPYNFTNLSLREIFSMHSFDKGEESWYDYPLVPHIMREGGYRVSFASNQISVCSEDGWAANRLGVYFFNIPAISRRSFDYRNDHIYTYDVGLLTELDLIHGHGSFEREFTILHMKGQHNHVAKYVPEDYVVFTSSDYTRKSHQNNEHVSYIATYDNATHYNDWVFSKICEYYSDRASIIIYLSDHGEEVHDYREYIGRSGAATQNDNVLYHQYQIPFVVYVSDKYKAAYPDVVKRIEGAVDKPFSSDNLAHMIIGLSGIETKWYDKTRDILHEQYDTSRQRSINTGQIYTKID